MNDELNSMTREQLQVALMAAQEELSDMEDERRFTLGQTGVHIGAAELKRINGYFERETKRLNERMAAIRDARLFSIAEESPCPASQRRTP
jgi:hypothetical protein